MLRLSMLSEKVRPWVHRMFVYKLKYYYSTLIDNYKSFLLMSSFVEYSCLLCLTSNFQEQRITIQLTLEIKN